VQLPRKHSDSASTIDYICGEPFVDGRNEIASFCVATVVAAEPGEAHGGAQLPQHVANQKGDTIVQFEVTQETGELKPTAQITPSITPVAIVFRNAG
jgi:hypothetical protein